MSTSTHSIKLSIPQPQEPGASLVGILEQHDPANTRGKKLAIVSQGLRRSQCSRLTVGDAMLNQILHGSLGLVRSFFTDSNIDQYNYSHKDYLYQKRLAHRLPIDSFRFDFRYGLPFVRFTATPIQTPFSAEEITNQVENGVSVPYLTTLQI